MSWKTERTNSQRVRVRQLLRGLRPWHDSERKYQELGRPCMFHPDRKGRTCCLRQRTHIPVRVVVMRNNRRGRKREGMQGVGSTHIRGVAEVMFCEAISEAT